MQVLTRFDIFTWFMWASIAQPVQRRTMGWMVLGSKPSGGEIFHTLPDRPRETTEPLTQWVLDLSRGVNGWGMALTTHPLASTEVKGRVEL